MNLHEVELNFFYLHWRDAQKFVEWAEEHDGKLRSLYARHSILSSVFAIEALVNKIHNDFYLVTSGKKSFERMNLRDRIYALPLVCGKDHPIGLTFDQAREPFQSFSELVDIRNWLVHPKGGTYIDARRQFGSIYVAGRDEEVPWVETDFSSVWPHTRIPVNPFELTGVHARQAFTVTNNLIDEFKRFFDGLVTEKWLDEITLRTKDGKHEQVITIQSLWGGYTPSVEPSLG